MKARATAVGIAVGLVSAMGVLTLSRESAQAKQIAFPEPASADVMRISSLASKDGNAGRRQMLALYRQNGLHSGTDYRMAAQTLEGAKGREELLMAHDLALAALALGDRGATPIVARTEDRLYKSLGLGERFGTLNGESLPLTTQHRQLMTMVPGPKMGMRVPAISVN